MAKKFLRKQFDRLAWRLYQRGEQLAIKQREQQYRDSATIDETATLDISASIFQNRNDKSKIKVGAHTIIKGQLLTFKHGGQISIGEYSFIGEGTRIWSALNISIGSRVLISHNVDIHDQISHSVDSKERHSEFRHIIETGLLKETDQLKEKEVIIEDDAWIGFGSIIMRGVRIGKGAIIGAGSVVTKDVADYTVVAGNPVRFLRHST